MMIHPMTEAAVERLLAELASLKDLDRRRLETKPGTVARERATDAMVQKSAELMEGFRRARAETDDSR
jgi:hypothetical protein